MARPYNKGVGARAYANYALKELPKHFLRAYVVQGQFLLFAPATQLDCKTVVVNFGKLRLKMAD